MNDIAVNRFAAANRARFTALRRFNWIDEIISLIYSWNQRHRTRQQLATLDTHIMNDIGVSQVQRMIESNKYFWEQ